MTNKSLWQQIKDVVDCDQAIATFQSEINVIERDLAKDRQQGGIQENLIKEKQRILFNLQKEIQLKELTTKDLKEKEDRKRLQHDQAKDQKEYMALEREITTLGKERAAHEEDIVKHWYNVDVLKKELEDLVSSKQNDATTREDDIAAKEAKLAHIHQELVTMTKTRNLAVQQLDPEIQHQYNRMHNNVPDPIVPVLNESCSACFYALSPQNLIHVKRGDVLTCRSCYRFLYFDRQEEKDAAKAQY